jgi:hypothetical protein
MKIYLAGKVAQMDWRHRLVSNLRDSVTSVGDWMAIESLPMVGGNTYVGPFFRGCDHGCFHGPNTHGAVGEGCMGDGECTAAARVYAKALRGIAACDLFILWMGLDFATAFGSLFELGAAQRAGKKIAVIKHSDLDARDFWFPMQAADLTLTTTDPIFAITQLLTPASSDRHYSLASLNPKHRVAA